VYWAEVRGFTLPLHTALHTINNFTHHQHCSKLLATMNFGYGIGDVFATIHAVKRIVEEVQNYRDAPRHFQQLSAELRLLQDTLQSVLNIRTADPVELDNLDRIRLIAIHCQQPLQAFIQKMRLSETSLGHFRTSGTISTVARRLHWSLIDKKDVEGLRKVVVSEMVAINILLGVQQLWVK
jgi:hypothetical protein